MITEFSLDLRLARRSSGLSKKAVAYLLTIYQSTYSEFERGAKVPSLEQICQLALIYGRSFQSYFGRITSGVKPPLAKRLEKLPKTKSPRLRIFNRGISISRMRNRLKPLNEQYGSA